MINGHELVPAQTGHVQGDHCRPLAHCSQIGRILNASAHSTHAKRPPDRFADPAFPRRKPLAHTANPSPLTGEPIQSP